MMPVIEIVLRLQISEETLDEVREAQEVGEFGTPEALTIVRDCEPNGVSLLHVRDENR